MQVIGDTTPMSVKNHEAAPYLATFRHQNVNAVSNKKPSEEGFLGLTY
jgi:hypothetical protein